MYDLVTWLRLPSVSQGLKIPGTSQVYGWQTHHLEGMNVTNNTKVFAYHNDTGKSLWFTKTKNGYPWDIKPYDSQFIWDGVTESNVNGWSNPKNFKTSGWQMVPRYWNGDPSVYVFHQSAVWKDYNNCKQASTGDVGPVWYTLQGPFDMDHGGNVGLCPTILLSYYWSGGKHREQLFLTSIAGWQEWTHAVQTNLAPGIVMYVIDTEVHHNQIVAGVVTPQFPCYQIP